MNADERRTCTHVVFRSVFMRVDFGKGLAFKFHAA